MTGDIRHLVAHVIAANDRYDAEELERAAQLLAEGYRLVDVNGGRSHIWVTDHLTDELLYEGPEDAALDRWASDRWYCYDSVNNDISVDNPVMDGWPAGLQDAIEDWVSDERYADVARAFAMSLTDRPGS